MGDGRARRIEPDPAVAREVDLDPGVRLAELDRLDPGPGVDVARQEALDDARRDVHVPQDRRHRRGVVLAEPLLEPGEALGDAEILALELGHVRAVVEGRRLQLALGGLGDVIRRVGLGLGQDLGLELETVRLEHARRQRRQVQRLDVVRVRRRCRLEGRLVELTGVVAGDGDHRGDLVRALAAVALERAEVARASRRSSA